MAMFDGVENGVVMLRKWWMPILHDRTDQYWLPICAAEVIGIGWHSRCRKEKESLEAGEKASREPEEEDTSMVQTVYDTLDMPMNHMPGATADEVNSEIMPLLTK